MPATIPQAVTGIIPLFGAIMLAASTARADGGSPPDSGCSTSLVGDRVTVSGECYFSPPWVSGASLELYGTVWGTLDSAEIHLSAGKIRVFNLTGESLVKIAVDGQPHALKVAPKSVGEVNFESEESVVVFSRRDETTLQITYRSSPILLSEGQGVVVDLTDPEKAACSLTVSGRKSDTCAPFVERIKPPSPRGGWASVTIALVLLYFRRRNRWKAA